MMGLHTFDYEDEMLVSVHLPHLLWQNSKLMVRSRLRDEHHELGKFLLLIQVVLQHGLPQHLLLGTMVGSEILDMMQILSYQVNHDFLTVIMHHIRAHWYTLMPDELIDMDCSFLLIIVDDDEECHFVHAMVMQEYGMGGTESSQMPEIHYGQQTISDPISEHQHISDQTIPTDSKPIRVIEELQLCHSIGADTMQLIWGLIQIMYSV